MKYVWGYRVPHHPLEDAMPKIVDHNKRRTEIVDRAIPIFAHAGYYQTNLSQIADLCGFKRTTIYKYFKGKDSIFIFAVDSILSRMETEAKSITSSNSTPAIEKIARVIENIVSYSFQNKDAMAIVLDLWLRIKRESDFPESDISDRIRALEAAFERIINEGMAAGEIRPIDSRAMACALFAFIESFVIHASLFENFTFTEVMNSVRILLEGMKLVR
jgi:AcrR family transcriptional regulator